MGSRSVGSVQSPEYDLLIRLLRELRESKGVSQRDLSSRLGAASTFIFKIEVGTRRLDFIELLEVLQQLDEPFPLFFERYLKMVNSSMP